MDKIAANILRRIEVPSNSHLINIGGHEQYWWPFYKNFVPDIYERYATAFRFVLDRGYKPIWIEDGFFGGRGRSRRANLRQPAGGVAGTCREKVTINLSGTEGKPVTIAGQPRAQGGVALLAGCVRADGGQMDCRPGRWERGVYKMGKERFARNAAGSDASLSFSSHLEAKSVCRLPCRRWPSAIPPEKRTTARGTSRIRQNCRRISTESHREPSRKGRCVMRDQDKTKAPTHLPELEELRGRSADSSASFPTLLSESAEQSLHASEERFRKVSEEGPLGVALINSDSRIQHVNRRFCEMLGYSEEEIIALGITGITRTPSITFRRSFST